MKTLIAIPCGDLCHTDFLRSLMGLEVSGDVQYTFAQGSLVYDSRNKLCEIAINEGFDRIVWIDSDMTFPSDMVLKFHEDLDSGMDMVCGLFTTRKSPIKPAIYKEIGLKQHEGEAWPTPYVETVTEWGAEPFEVAACGFAAVMISVDLLKRVRAEFGLPFSPVVGFGEDLSFCLRVTQLGAKIMCDPRIEVGHVGLHTYTVHDM